MFSTRICLILLLNGAFVLSGFGAAGLFASKVWSGAALLGLVSLASLALIWVLIGIDDDAGQDWRKL